MLSLLQDVKVLDVSVLAPGAIMTQKLADLGANVILVERLPMGNFLRSMPPLGIGDAQHTGRGLHHPEWSRGKRSIKLDLSEPADRPSFEALVRSADVFVEGSRPGVMQRLGADYEALKRINPALVYCSITAWGQTGPYRDLPAHAASFELAAGLGHLVRVNEEGRAEYDRPRGLPTANGTGALNAVAGVLAALLRRQRTGEGACLDVSVWEAAVSDWQSTRLTFVANTGTEQVASETYGPNYAPYETSDGRFVFVALLRPKFWERFCEVTGRPDLLDAIDPYRDDPSGAIAYTRDAPGLGDELRAIFAARTFDEWMLLAVEKLLPITPVLDTTDLLTDAQFVSREIMTETSDPELGEHIRVPALPVKLAGEVYNARPAPTLGEHTEEILRELRHEERIATGRAVIGGGAIPTSG